MPIREAAECLDGIVRLGTTSGHATITSSARESPEPAGPARQSANCGMTFSPTISMERMI
jgi:hypothetical protein